MRKPQRPTNSLNVIVADTDWQTFETLTGFSDDYNMLNLSSDLAVNFIMEYEHIDVILVSNKIANLQNLKKQASRKKINIYILGYDTKYPVDKAEISKILENERHLKLQKPESARNNGSKNMLSRIFKKDDATKKTKREMADWYSNTEKDKVKLVKNIKSCSEQDSKKNNKAKESNKNPEEKDFFDSFVFPDDEFWQDKKTGKNRNAFKAEKQEDKKIEKLSFNKIDSGLKNSLKEKLDSAEKEYSLMQDRTLGKSKLRQPSTAASYTNVIAVKQKTIVFIRAKGGVGSTILSLYLANKFSKLKTLLIDLNFSEGGSDVGYYLEIPKAPNMVMFTEGYNRDSLNNSVINIKNNFDVLQPPPTYELSKKMDLQDIYSIVDVARKKYHLIIFDMPNSIDDIYLGVLDLADLAIMVSDLSHGSIARLTGINNRFIYSDLEKILILNRNSNGNRKHASKNSIKDFFGIKDVISLNENTFLSGRSEFCNFDFERLEEFEVFTQKVMERLTCD